MYCILNLAVENNDSVAQLGERYLDRVEVVGSSPIGITIEQRSVSLIYQGVQTFCFKCNRFRMPLNFTNC